MRPRLLLLLPQWPRDPASGAARNLLSACRMLVARGWEARALATTASESPAGAEVLQWAHTARIDTTTEHTSAGRSIIRYQDDGLTHVLLDVAPHSPWTWETPLGPAFDDLYRQVLDEFRPQVIYTFGGTNADRRHRAEAQRRGCRVIFGLQNLSYLDRRAFEHVDAVLCCSAFLRDEYERAIGLESTALPLPIDPGEVLAAAHERVFVTMVNPSPEKGLFFLVRLCEEVAVRRPDIPMLIVGSRSTADHLAAAAGAAGGYDLRRHRNLMYSAGVTSPKEIFAVTRVLLVPSVWPEPAGRVAAEALLNAIPPLVSNRGGLPEVCRGGGFVLPLPEALTPESRTPVAAESVRPWLDVIARLCGDVSFYDDACDRARQAGRAYDFEATADLYDAFFTSMLQRPAPRNG